MNSLAMLGGLAFICMSVIIQLQMSSSCCLGPHTRLSPIQAGGSFTAHFLPSAQPLARPSPSGTPITPSLSYASPSRIAPAFCRLSCLYPATLFSSQTYLTEPVWSAENGLILALSLAKR